MSDEPLLAACGVRRRLGHGAAAVEAVRDATLAVAAGETVAVMGPSGSGKSTLLCLLSGLLVPDGGEVVVAGRALHALGESARTRLRRSTMGFVFQRFNLLKALTALENVEIALRIAGVDSAAARRRALVALEAVGLAARARALPRDLSGGEQQRVAIARALAPAPSVILGDEPTGSLDSTNGRDVVAMIRAHVRAHGAAAVIVTHDHRVAAAVDRRLWMEDGVLREHAASADAT
jgi:putative ABC transport system ATP-binding protein